MITDLLILANTRIVKERPPNCSEDRVCSIDKLLNFPVSILAQFGNVLWHIAKQSSWYTIPIKQLYQFQDGS